MSEIRVATVYLENLASRMDDTARDLRDYTNLGAYDLSCSPVVRDAFEERNDDWNVKRDKLAEALRALADGFRTASSSISQTDEELAAALNDASNGNA